MDTARHPSPTVGDLLREWRRHRRLSQLELAADADVSTRHLSFVESGRANASADVLLKLAHQLSMPLRVINRLMVAGGYAPRHAERPLDAPDMDAARAAVNAVLDGHAPYPALAVDRHWNLVMANAAVAPLLAGVDASLLAGPVNVLRLSLHPLGLAPRIENFAEWRHHLLERLAAQADASADPVLVQLLAELKALPAGPPRAHATQAAAHVAVALRLRPADGGPVLSLLSTTTVFGTATDVTLSELALECFYPADEATRAALQQAARG